MSEERKKLGVAFWATVVVVVVLVLYPLSWGPVTWVTFKTKMVRHDWVLTAENFAYPPLFCAIRYAPGPVIELWNSYHKWWTVRAVR